MIVHPGKLTPHPLNEKIYGDESIEELKQSIAASKWIKTLVVTPNHVIISGHRRWRVAMELGLDVPIEYKAFASEIDELEALLLENDSRDKTPEQKVREAEYWHKIETDRSHRRMSEAAKAQKQGCENFRTPGSHPVRAINQVAEKVGFGSGRTYEKAATVVGTADKLKTEGKVDQAQALLKTLNTKSVHKAYQEVKKQEKQEQRAEEAKTVILPYNMQILHGDFRILGHEILDESVDLIFTDPPYHEEHLPLWSDLALFAERVLKPGGILLAYSGQIFLPDVLNYLSKHLTYCWLLSVAHTGGHIQIWKHNVWNDWKPIVMFSKGKPVVHDWLMDLYRGDKGDKEAHEWSQGEGEAAYFLEKLSKPGQFVVDPMCGSGTILRASHRLFRKSLGMEISEERYKVALTTLKDVVRV